MPSLTFPTNLGQLIDQDGGFPHCRISTSQSGLEIDNINLYVPSGLSLADGASYEGVDMSKVYAGREGMEGNLTDEDKFLMGGKALAEFADTIGDFLAADNLGRGIAINPNQEMAFTSMNIRSFQMSWKLVPESEKDANAAHKIIAFFRKYMYPKRKGTFALEYPPQFRIQFYIGEKESLFLPTIYDSYCTGLSVNYNGQEGSMIYLNNLEDYIGTEVQLQVDFSEAKMLTRDELYPEKNLNEIQNDDRPPYVSYPKPKGEGGNG